MPTTLENTLIRFNDGTTQSTAATTPPAASTAVAGIVQLSTATDSTSTTLAATASAVKAAYDRAVPDTASKAANGWFKAGSSGLIIQWATGAADGTAEDAIAITFPLAFPSACLFVMPGLRGANTNANDTDYQVVSFTTTSATLVRQNMSSAVTTAYPLIIAIGY